jgi:hypothetical protein
MEKIPTAKELIRLQFCEGEFDEIMDCLNGSIEPDITQAMIEFAKLHVEQALKEVSCKLYDTYHTVCEDGTTKGVFKTQEEALNFANTLNNTTKLYHDWVKVVRLGGGMSTDSILNSYPLENIK